MLMTRVRLSPRSCVGLSLVVFAGAFGAALMAGPWSAAPKPRSGDGQAIFRFDTFGDEQLWTDRLTVTQVIQSPGGPSVPQRVGLNVDSDALPASLLASHGLNDPAIAVQLIRKNSVI